MFLTSWSECFWSASKQTFVCYGLNCPRLEVGEMSGKSWWISFALMENSQKSYYQKKCQLFKCNKLWHSLKSTKILMANDRSGWVFVRKCRRKWSVNITVVREILTMEFCSTKWVQTCPVFDALSWFMVLSGTILLMVIWLYSCSSEEALRNRDYIRPSVCSIQANKYRMESYNVKYDGNIPCWTCNWQHNFRVEKSKIRSQGWSEIQIRGM